MNPTCVSESSSTDLCYVQFGSHSGFPSSRINLSPYLTRVFACVIVSSPTFAGSDRRGGSFHWRGDFTFVVFLFCGPEIVSIIVFFSAE